MQFCSNIAWLLCLSCCSSWCLPPVIVKTVHFILSTWTCSNPMMSLPPSCQASNAAYACRQWAGFSPCSGKSSAQKSTLHATCFGINTAQSKQISFLGLENSTAVCAGSDHSAALTGGYQPNVPFRFLRAMAWNEAESEWGGGYYSWYSFRQNCFSF